MSAHPYRQKAAPSPPYPVDDLTVQALSSSSSLPNSQNLPSPQNMPSSQNSHISQNSHMSRDHAALPMSPQFMTKEQSPSPQMLSATSSLTNLNLPSLSQPALYSQSESNLPHTHSRSVSSTSSFFYDRPDNSSLVDFSQSVLQQHLGSNSSHLVPRLKTLELYRKNAKRSTDPAVLFQYAQHMLQTALMLENTSPEASTPATPKTHARLASSSSLSVDGHKRTRSHSFSFDDIESTDPKLKLSLLKEAHHYLKKLADKGYVEAQYLLGDAYSSGAFGRVENKEAFNLFLSAAKHGHTESAFRTAHCYEEGLGTGRDSRKTVDFLRMAASKNHPAAMYKLGMYSFYARMGLPDTVNTKKAGIKWLERASNVATELTAAAPYELGKLYQNGFMDILLKDEKYALELYAQAAALGHVQSSAILGKCYEIGEVVPQDANLSIHYYTQAALGGHPESMLAMCAWYLVGAEPHLPKDESEAFEWAKRAALCELPKAQFALGNFYDKGIGCIRNSAEAQSWYKKAAENGDEKALSRITNKELAAQLSKNVKRKKGRTTSSAAQEKECVIM
ncbi:hypothetical protein EJF18_10974 [Clavispora lusitaniae]|uniref:Uncharacterized protein n=2 Tax=Clavispora lusitaniae TaxID=36911 RepID=A0ACD0WEZ7_CLALS|nr:hypothetical protein E0198_000230 [Clavispora lusitaniae]KAF7584818.1 Sel1 repeat family protein [Clavispora lusitaniae]OVF08075.1 putative phosphoglycerate kinase [Clavispora lusitaniae]QFZ25855.1 hypothetical protein EJF14_10974 [Clavispora lusitaniae]QFZ30842.1 hypothetical protein EJF16_10974 [Clavispora lusitaniae]